MKADIGDIVTTVACIVIAIACIAMLVAVVMGSDDCRHKGGQPYWPQGLCLTDDGRIIR